MVLFCRALDVSVPGNDFIAGVDSQKSPRKYSAEFQTEEGMLRRWLRSRPFLDYHGQRPTSKIAATLQESIQLQHVFLIHVVAISHGSHQSQVFAHERTDEAAESWHRPECGKSRTRIATEQRPHYWRGHSLAILFSQLGQWVFLERTSPYGPIQITIHKTSTMGNQVKGPSTVPNPQPFVHHLI